MFGCRTWILVLGIGCVLSTGCGKWRFPQPPVPDVAPKRQERLKNTIASFDRERDRAQYLAAVAYFRQGEIGRSKEMLELILARNPEHSDSRVLLAEVLLAEGEIAPAMEHLQTSLAERPNDARVQHLLGVVMEEAGNIEEARACFLRATQLAPENTVYRASYDQAIQATPAEPQAEKSNAPVKTPSPRKADSNVKPVAHLEPAAEVSFAEPPEPEAEQPTISKVELRIRQPANTTTSNESADTDHQLAQVVTKPATPTEPARLPESVQESEPLTTRWGEPRVPAKENKSAAPARQVPDDADVVWMSDRPTPPAGPAAEPAGLPSVDRAAIQRWRNPPRELPVEHAKVAPVVPPEIPLPQSQLVPTTAATSQPTDDEIAEALAKAQQAWEQRDLNLARHRITDVLRWSPKNVPAQLLMAETLLAEGYVDRAVDRMERVVAGQPDNPEALFALGLILEAAERPDEAQACYEQAEQLLQSKSGVTTVANSSTSEEDDTPAPRLIPAHEQARQPVSPRSVAELLDRGQLELARGNFRAAADCFRKAVEMSQYDSETTLAGAIALLKNDQPRLAAELVQLALPHHPDSAPLYRTLGAAHFRLKEFRQAKDSLEKALALDNAHALSYFLLGCALRELGDTERARVHLQQAARMDGRFAAVP